MNTALRAAADRVIYDVAALRTIGDSLEDADFDAVCPAAGRTVAATFRALVGYYRAAALALRALPDSAQSLTVELPALEPADANDPDEIDEALAAAVCEFVDRLIALQPANVTRSVAETVTAWSSVGARHALDFLEAIPDLAQNPLLLTWAVFPLAGEPEGLHERRLAVVRQAREARKKQR